MTGPRDERLMAAARAAVATWPPLSETVREKLRALLDLDGTPVPPATPAASCHTPSPVLTCGKAPSSWDNAVGGEGAP